VTVEQWFEPDDGLSFALRLVNSWDELEEDPELLRDPEIVERFLRRHGLEAAASLVDQRELRALRALRARLREAWDAPEERAVELLNELRASVRVAPQLVRAGSRWTYRWDRPGLRASAFAPGLAASGLLDEIRDHGTRRLGVCSAAPCRCVFVDRSKSASRRYCSDQCANRRNQQVHRARRRRA